LGSLLAVGEVRVRHIKLIIAMASPVVPPDAATAQESRYVAFSSAAYTVTEPGRDQHYVLHRRRALVN
jgi:hypothetical protein